jgi:hypothetical protein
MKPANFKMFWLLLAIAATSGFFAGCSRQVASTPVPAVAHEREPQPPHGGTLVELRKEENYLEFVQDPSAGTLQAFVFDGEVENFVRDTMPSFEMTAKFPRREETLVFKAVPNRATGEQVGSTSLFEAQADWLKQPADFAGVIKEFTVGANRYQNVTFHFPKTGDKDRSEQK